jgi:hypothetical protein
MNNLIKQLVNDPEFYQQWFETANETQEQMLWKEIWDRAAETHSENEFVQGVYEFYQKRGFLTYKQFYFLASSIMKTTHSLKDRLNGLHS